MARRVSGQSGVASRSRGRLLRRTPPSAAAALAASFLIASCTTSAQQTVAPQTQTVLDRISANSLRGDVSFLASDALQGRLTPSPGLTVASEYIASQFRRAGLEPMGDDGYFQTATFDDLGARGQPLRMRLGPAAEGAVMRNVAGLLRGSDPVLRDTYIIVSAHYDHVGVGDPRRGAEGAARGKQAQETGVETPGAANPPANAPADPDAPEDRIFNGANDDASGTATVMELAWALAGLPEAPKRSILFLAYFGEERGMLGSRYYGAHPLVPVAKTIANLNLEHIGRSDGNDGPHLRKANLTGYDFSDLPQILAKAAAAAGVTIEKDAENSDPFFSASDNITLANLGVPSHTLSVTYLFPDYHQVGDEWDKLDYGNMALVNRAIALGLLRLASDAPPPQWNATYPPAQKFVQAGRRLRETGDVPATLP